MRTFKQFIAEDDEPDIEAQIEAQIERIRYECSDWLKATGDKNFYRGVTSAANLYDYNNGFYGAKVRQNRIPRDSSGLFTDIFNVAIEKKFGIKHIRNISSFCTQNLNNAHEFGGKHGLIFFPFYPNGYRVLSSPYVDDSYEDFDTGFPNVFSLFERLFSDLKVPEVIEKNEAFLRTLHTHDNAKSIKQLRNLVKDTIPLVEFNQVLEKTYIELGRKYIELNSGKAFPNNLRNSEVFVFNVNTVYLLDRNEDRASELLRRIYKGYR